MLTRIHTADAREQHRHSSGKAERSRLVATRGTLTTGLLELAALRPDVRLDVRVRHTCRESKGGPVRRGVAYRWRSAPGSAHVCTRMPLPGKLCATRGGAGSHHRAPGLHLPRPLCCCVLRRRHAAAPTTRPALPQAHAPPHTHGTAAPTPTAAPAPTAAPTRTAAPTPTGAGQLPSP